MKVITDQTFASEVLSQKGITIVDFAASWCGPCKQVETILTKLAEQFSDIKVVKMNVEESQMVASQYMITSLPTVLVFLDGTPVDMKQGLRPYSDYEKSVEEHLLAA